MILEFWIGLLTGLSAASLLWIKMLKRHYQNVVTIKKAEKDLESLISQIYHKDIYPELCRAEGLFRLSKIEIEQALKDCELASRPEHYRYMTLVKTALEEMKEKIIIPGINEMVVLKDRFQKIITKYN
jgi:hypothetical protein